MSPQETITEGLKWGQIFLEKGKVDLAIANFESVLEIDPHNEDALCGMQGLKYYE